jgi:hypothetical protein
MYPFRYEVSLRIKHPTMNAEAICKKVGLRVERKWTVGSQRKTPKGTPLTGVNKSTYCCFKLEHPKELILADFLRSCNRRLYRHERFFEHIRSTGGSLEYFIAWYSDRNSGETFDFDLLSMLVRLKIDLSIDFYGGNQPCTERKITCAESRRKT